MQEIARSPENPRHQPSNSPHIFNPINVLGVQSQIFISLKPRFSTRVPISDQLSMAVPPEMATQYSADRDEVRMVHVTLL